MRSLKWVSVPHRSFISIARITSAWPIMRAAEALIERMPRREIHAAGIVDDAALQRFGKRDEVRHAGRRARHAIADDDRVLRLDQHFGGFRDRAGIALRRDHRREFRNAQAFRIGDRIFLQLGIERDEDRPHRRRGRDLVGAHRGLGEMRQARPADRPIW